MANFTPTLAWSTAASPACRTPTREQPRDEGGAGTVARIAALIRFSRILGLHDQAAEERGPPQQVKEEQDQAQGFHQREICDRLRGPLATDSSDAVRCLTCDPGARAPPFSQLISAAEDEPAATWSWLASVEDAINGFFDPIATP